MPARSRPVRPTEILPLPAQPTVRELAYRRLRQLILDGTLGPGERIFENELADQLGISRTPLREALRQLETDGLVELSARRGAMIARLSAANMQEDFQIRATLEGLAITLAGPRLTSDDLQHMADELALMRDTLAGGPRAAFLQHHRLFHTILFQASGAPRLARMLANLLEASERYEQLELGHDVLHADEIAHHHELLELLQAGDADEAATRYVRSFLAHGDKVIHELVHAQSVALGDDGASA